MTVARAARPVLIAIAALVLALACLWTLERARHDIAITQISVGKTPVTRYAKPDADGPAVVVAHGFAGSRQIMQAYSLALARAGYAAYAFDFEGHGRNPVPMSGDVTAIDGTTRLLVDQTRAVVDAVAMDGPVALLGHSMASDILVRVALETPGDEPLVLISAFSEAIDDAVPDQMLLVAGAWEPGLRDFALRALRMVQPDAGLGQTVTAGGVTRRAALAPAADHVAILHSRAAMAESTSWLDRANGRASDITYPRTGWALLGLLAALVALTWPLARALPARDTALPALAARRFALAIVVPAIAAPLIAVPLNMGWLPVLVADYLALHLFIYGAMQLAVLRWLGRPLGPLSPGAIALLLIWGLAVFGFALDRYGANFWPGPGRGWVLVALVAGALPFGLSDALLVHHAPFWQRVLARLGFFASLALAVAMDFEGLFFVVMIVPVILLFFLVFGSMGRAVALRAGAAAPGLALGVILGWALAVSFPLFQG
ncbi:lysophospholipase [Lutimaribacter sp. EGI FJ00015]|uniref:Lysophospholipase n=1 Tax=Lutimaribacter degradans TaxID=2945989 RepID=A0ACC5ZWD5_9RHOB|nr:alpha/beta fold hydrolase [Lutimaribacter sp. EGI FJ00013]MCM2562622.1 lysophospholipase [Lutimaribacter sp. EGI FJ00013]MCO0613779.1 lysophospholipase [Lutimaribacter sp. EGI FJ00015]MCO0636738.1 lysophospholipase [Lutimaribacter sp. EGI FJ00014]